MWLVCAASAALFLLLAGRPLLLLLPEPEVDPGEVKLPYRSLPTVPFVAVTTLVGGTLTAAAAWRTPVATWPLWLVLGTLGVLLGAVDARTTWLPLRLTHGLWAATAAALGVLALASPAAAGRALLGAGLAGGFFWLIWRVAGGLGFGDVRLAPVIGAVAASASWSVLLIGLVLGTALGAVYAFGRSLWARFGPFPYGPFLILGPYLALLLQ